MSVTNINIDRSVMPEYGTDKYRDIVIAGSSINGWRCPDVGLGGMRMTHPSHKDFKVYKGLSEDWMKECWEDFVAYADKLDT